MPDTWPALDAPPPCPHVRIDTTGGRTRVEVVPPGQRGIVIAVAVLRSCWGLAASWQACS